MVNPTEHEYDERAWNEIKDFMNGNEYATAGWMANLYAESWILPFRKQGDFTATFAPSHEYTNNIDTGVISKDTFIHDGIGYGLAQWTFYSRKEGMYDFWNTDEYRGGEVSIGSWNFNMAWFKKELLSPGYVGIYNHMLTVTDVYSAADYVLEVYERPADIPGTKPYRRELASFYYEKYTGKTPYKKKFKWIYYMRRKY